MLAILLMKLAQHIDTAKKYAIDCSEPQSTLKIEYFGNFFSFTQVNI